MHTRATAEQMEQTCPRCKTTSYQNPNMKLLVNVCGHRLCEACVDSVFTRPSAACPECGLALRRNLFRLQQFEDSYVEKEVEIRKKILKDFNKTEEDFSSLSEYNDYLEEIETIVYNLANGINVEETRHLVEQYKKDNQTVIVKNRARQLRQEQLVRSQLELEKADQEMRNKMAAEQELETIKLKRKQKESFLNELVSSDKPPEEVLAEFKANAELMLQKENDQATKATGIFSKPTYQQQVGEIAFEPLPVATGELYTYQPLLMDNNGPPVPDVNTLESLGYLQNVRQLEAHNIGGGFLPKHACHRALQEAFAYLNWHQEFR